MNMEYVWTATSLWGIKSEIERARDTERERPAIWVKEKHKKTQKEIGKIIPSTASYLNHY